MHDTKTELAPPEVHQVSEDDVKEREKARLSPFFTLLFSGFALMSDGYQVGVLSLVNVCLGNIYGDKYTSAMSTRLGNAMFVGIVLGQIGFGFFIDRWGRKMGLLLTTFLVILGAALCAGAPTNGSVESTFWALTIYRGILGVGVGGEYPCSSVNASESADSVRQGRRGMLVSLTTNTVIDFGFVLAGIVPLIFAAAGCSNQAIWRASFGFGVIPPLSVLYFRLKMTNSEIFKKNAMKHNVPYLLIIKRYWRYLLGTAGTWFIYDFITYPFGLFSGTITDNVLGANATFIQVAGWSTLINFFYVPGCFGGAFLSDRIGRRKTILVGFGVQGILGILMGIWYKNLAQNIFPLFVVLYGVFLALGELGPGCMTIVTSSEIYPTAIRGTAYGWSAAIGKIGAIVGTSAFKPAVARFGGDDVLLGQGRVFMLASGLAIFGGLYSYFLLPEYSQQDLFAEDEAFRQYLIENGHDVSTIGEHAAREEEVKA
ncbi:hypothetical protein EMPS_05718 [Entomortierella parvispora]|uniref:Major facilitator superfamily (MFS) profile domain-containing protein n=1 Tax=Entomortierella parvispora TaxID=205924 RepID=A0A9P3LX12_9FUNG|nr:hypothetical protein EMPS_05718 [Entomortierella parvispora]